MGFIITKPTDTAAINGLLQIVASESVALSASAITAIPFLKTGKTAIIAYMDIILTATGGGPMPAVDIQVQKGAGVGDFIQNLELFAFTGAETSVNDTYRISITGKAFTWNTTTDVLNFEKTAGNNSGIATINFIGYYL